MQHYVVNTIKTQVSKLDLNFCYKELDKNIHHLKDNVGQFIGFRMTATYSKNKIYKLLVVSSLYVCNVAIENVYIYIYVFVNIRTLDSYRGKVMQKKGFGD